MWTFAGSMTKVCIANLMAAQRCVCTLTRWQAQQKKVKKSLLLCPEDSGKHATARQLLCCVSPVHAGTYLLCSTSQSAYPKKYQHEDGGMYNGQWQGRKKQGLGSYHYPGGAKYQGEWRNNAKEGRGVYLFPKARACRLSQSLCVQSLQASIKGFTSISGHS